MRLTLANTTSSHLPKTLVTRALQTAARITSSRKQVYEITVSFVGDQQIKKINRRYRKADRVTDILSFTYQRAESKINYRKNAPNSLKGPYGELVLALDQITRQAKLHNKTIKAELRDVLIHGYLHLLGHDHHKVRERRIMRQWEDRIKRDFQRKFF
ncbi:MAG: rRNA maturation RNase YbeY [bacterium]